MVRIERALYAPLSRRQVLRGAGLLAGGTALAQFGIGCGGSSEKSKSTAGGGPEKTTLKVGIIKFADTIPFWVADQQGFFKKAGLTTVQGIEMVGGTAIQPAIQSGQLDMGWASVVSVVTAKARNFDFEFFAGGSSVGPGHYKNESMLVKSDSPIHSAQDLVGKKVGLNTLGNIAELEVRWWLGGAGVDTSKVKLVELNAVGPDEVPPLIQGRVDAIQVNEPTVTAALKKGGVRTVGDWSFLDPQHVFLAGWVATGKWLDGHANTAKAFARAMKDSADWIAANKSAANKLVSEKTGVPQPLIDAMVPSQITIPVTQDDVTPLIDACKRYGLSNKTFPASDIVWQGSAA
jgi:NitT/TauT family transport system substrate-binding protein